MIYKSLNDALKAYQKRKNLPFDMNFDKHLEKYDFSNTNSPSKIGQFFVYEEFTAHNRLLQYPRLGIYINTLLCDQTIEVEWVDYRRTWESNVQYEYEYNGKKYISYVSSESTKVRAFPLWSKHLLVYGLWDKMPNWSQLKQAYEKTWWFYRTPEEKRDIQLRRILK